MGGQGVLAETMAALHPYVGFFILPLFVFTTAGVRIDPPPSLAWAAGTTPAATAAAAPPEEPPGVRERSQGLRHGPSSRDSVTGIRPNSGVLVLPKITSPLSL